MVKLWRKSTKFSSILKRSMAALKWKYNMKVDAPQSSMMTIVLGGARETQWVIDGIE